ncbi:predicted protein [Sclerotinia sclerotiorum 1980 UF-70]|uniref:Uncharacterized protein n=1 Tax=Sclerotinia sclerotiorum (strain ATCC 18683 / 1980 / Ss-1) TaxID=665079 RepID=A7EYT8_SCLS1|nr:predicted protein [Sclerotinia sclerotiorum 1980 UF-70]EDN94630.1 predicted protein [Sclerotinia sclerotiorum 1980 UF-70]
MACMYTSKKGRISRLKGGCKLTVLTQENGAKVYKICQIPCNILPSSDFHSSIIQEGIRRVTEIRRSQNKVSPDENLQTPKVIHSFGSSVPLDLKWVRATVRHYHAPGT